MTIVESRRKPAYMSELRSLGYSDDELVRIEDLDDEMRYCGEKLIKIKGCRYEMDDGSFIWLHSKSYRHEFLNELERRWNDKAREKVKELISDTDDNWIAERKLVFVREKVKSIKLLEKRMQKKNYPYLLRKILWEILEADKWLKRENYLKRPKSSNDDISDKDIELARTVDIGNIVEINERGFALCPAHPDKHPSLYCRNNYAYCFSCGFKADSIGLVMKINNLGFIEAIKYLKNK